MNDAASVGLGLGKRRRHHRQSTAETIAGSDRSDKAKFVDPRRAEAVPRHEMIDHHAHHEGGGLPPARDQSAERRVSCRDRVGMKGLWVVLTRESDDPRLVHAFVSELDDLSGPIVFEVALAVRVPPRHQSLSRTKSLIFWW